MGLKIEKVKRRVDLLLSDGSRITGNLFLSRHSPTRKGTERISDLLLSQKIFIPIELDEGAVRFLQKDCICLVLLETDELDKTLPYLRRATVRVYLLSGETLRGNVYLDLPKSRSRLSDFFNFCPGFFYLEVEGKEYLVNTRFVQSVQPVDG